MAARPPACLQSMRAARPHSPRPSRCPCRPPPRLIDVTAGSICLAGLDTTSVALDVLRRQLAIIPQDPVLFSGTIR